MDYIKRNIYYICVAMFALCFASCDCDYDKYANTDTLGETAPDGSRHVDKYFDFAVMANLAEEVLPIDSDFYNLMANRSPLASYTKSDGTCMLLADALFQYKTMIKSYITRIDKTPYEDIEITDSTVVYIAKDTASSGDSYNITYERVIISDDFPKNRLTYTIKAGEEDSSLCLYIISDPLYYKIWKTERGLMMTGYSDDVRLMELKADAREYGMLTDIGKEEREAYDRSRYIKDLPFNLFFGFVFYGGFVVFMLLHCFYMYKAYKGEPEQKNDIMITAVMETFLIPALALLCFVSKTILFQLMMLILILLVFLFIYEIATIRKFRLARILTYLAYIVSLFFFILMHLIRGVRFG